MQRINIFDSFYDNEARIKKAMSKNPYYISSVIEYFIGREEIDAELFPNGKFTEKAAGLEQDKKE